MKGLNVKKLMKNVNVENATIVVLLVILVVLVVRYVNDKNNENFEVVKRENFGVVKKEPFSNRNVTINFFYVDWCPHCKTAKPVIAELKRKRPDITVNEINCEKPENKQLVEKNNIKGYPTIRGSSNGGKVLDFMKRVTLENLSAFVDSL